jgi:hypothetical protein
MTTAARTAQMPHRHEHGQAAHGICRPLPSHLIYVITSYADVVLPDQHRLARHAMKAAARFIS